MLDSTGSSGVMRGHLESGISAAVALAGLADLASAAAAFSSCVPVRISVVFRADDTNPPAPASDSDARRAGLFVFSTDDDPLAIASVPGISETVLETEGCFAGERVDLLNSDVAAFVAAIVTGIFSDPWANDLSDVVAAYLREEH